MHGIIGMRRDVGSAIQLACIDAKQLPLFIQMDHLQELFVTGICGQVQLVVIQVDILDVVIESPLVPSALSLFICLPI